MEITLQYPYKTDSGKDITALTMRRPTVKDLRLAQSSKGGPAGAEIAMMARLTGLIPEDLDPMDQVDYKQLQTIYLEMVEGHSKSDGQSVGIDGSAGEMV